MGNRITGSIEWYQSTTTDVLFRLPIIQPGPNANLWQNFSDVEIINKGVDISVNALLIEKDDFTLDVGYNMSFFNNVIEDNGNILEVGIQTGEINGAGLTGQRSQLLYSGQEIYAFYLPIFTGFDDAGNSTFRDLNNDGVVSASSIDQPGTGDRAFVGSPNPDFNLGLTISSTYKKWDASMFFNGVFGNQIFDNTSLALFSQNGLSGGNNVTSDIVGLGQSAGDAAVPSTRFLKDGDFIRLANLTVGYTFDMEKLSWLSSLRVYFTGQNLFLITDYDGFDPEVNINKAVDGVPSFGIDYAAYPRARTINFGLDVKF